jgi:hypothetical protein
MLTSEEAQHVYSNFNIYDQNWQFYENILGECNLLDDALCYCDGTGLYLAAFSLKTPGKQFTWHQIKANLTRAFELYKSSEIRFINIWGQFDDVPCTCELPSSQTSFALCQQSNYTDFFDTIFDLDRHFISPSKRAKRRQNLVKNKNTVTSVHKLRTLTHEHLRTIEQWLEHHEVSTVHKEFIYSLPTYVKYEDVFVCEARAENHLLGFSVIAAVGKDRIVIQNSFPLRKPGFRIGDALFLETVSFARSISAKWLHLGYSITESLLRSKEAWGSVTRSLPYREVFYVADDAWSDRIRDGTFLWRQRLTG